MVFRIVRSKASTEDLRIIFRHLIDSYVSLGDDVSQAADRALRRMDGIERDLQSIARSPHQGTLTSYPGFDSVRHVTKNKVVFYFQVQETQKVLRLLAVFFGGQDHQRHMLKRLS
jgi:plasmid stabilization system protein ParE